MVLITPRLVRALEPDEVPPLPTLPRRFLPAPGAGGVEKGAPGNPEKTDKGSGQPPGGAQHRARGRSGGAEREAGREADAARAAGIAELSRAMSLKERTFASEQGAVFVQVGISLFVMMAFNVFVLDYGVMWVGRRQAQNAADAGALAGATARPTTTSTTPPAPTGSQRKSA